MGGINKKTRKKLYKLLVERDSECCRNCKVPATEKQLVIDHKNNNSKDNRLENLQLLCRKCNYLKNPRKKPFDFVCVSVCDERDAPPELKENRRMEPLFRQWLLKKMMENHPIRFDEAKNAGAEYVGCSSETTRKYLRTMTSSEGNYVIIRDSHGYEYIDFRELS